MDDRELLAQYVREQSHDAFATLVRRHIDLVYAACLRQTRNATLAEDAAQAVFLILAQRAATLRPGTVLAGWLYNTARYAASNAVRTENRRKYHEHKAAQNMETIAPPSPGSADPGDTLWTEMAPVLDDAVASLGGRDRDAVLLRFFENKSLKDVADALGVSEVAAKKRVSRAVEKLRRFFTRRGVTVSAAALAVLLSGATAKAAAPPAIATAAATLSSTTTALANVSTLAQGTLLMIQIKTNTTIAAIVVALLLVGAGAFQMIRSANADNVPAARQTASTTTPTAPTTTSKPVPAPVAAADPQTAFDALYSLKADEVLKRIPPPYHPLRAQVVLKPMFTGGKLPQQDLSHFGAIVFYWVPPGKPERRVTSTIEGTVGLAIRDCLDLPNYQVEIPEALRDQPLPGDWIVRMSAPLEQRQHALEEILRTLPKPIRLEKYQAERNVIVARGRYAFHPLPGISQPQSIHVGPGDLLHLERDPTQPWKDEGRGGGSGSLKSFLTHVADTINQYVIDETDAPGTRVEWRNHAGRADDKDDNRDSLLWNLTRQTSLRFTPEKRMVDIWTLSEQP